MLIIVDGLIEYELNYITFFTETNFITLKITRKPVIDRTAPNTTVYIHGHYYHISAAETD
jgi:hypothetical protein